jgi:anti-sigma28 factor (negative regulator of flagellin synthesis)
MRPDLSAAETVDMTVLAVSYDTRPGRFGRRRSGDEDAGRRVRDAQDETTMDLDREMHVQEIRERIERHAYDVDPQQVAGAIVARLLAASRAEKPRD